MALALRHRRARDQRVDNILVAKKEAALYDSMGEERSLRRPVVLRRRVTTTLPATTVVPPFAELPVPEDYIMGVPEVDEGNRSLSAIYESIAHLRHDSNAAKASHKKDAISYWRQMNASVTAEHHLRLQAESLRNKIMSLGGVPIPEPSWFSV